MIFREPAHPDVELLLERLTAAEAELRAHRAAESGMPGREGLVGLILGLVLGAAASVATDTLGVARSETSIAATRAATLTIRDAATGEACWVRWDRRTVEPQAGLACRELLWEGSIAATRYGFVDESTQDGDDTLRIDVVDGVVVLGRRVFRIEP